MCTELNAKSIRPAQRIEHQKPSIWVEINNSVAKYKPINLGQGFPDILPKDHVLESLRLLGQPDVNPLLHQYTRSMGHPRLVQVLAKLYSNFLEPDPNTFANCPQEVQRATFHPGRQVDPFTEVLVSIGAYGSLSAAISAFVDPADEVLIMDPSFDCYAPMTILAGGKPVYISLTPQPRPGEPLTSNCWRFDIKEIESKITPKTKVLILNTPHNPLGKVFDAEEIQALADLCIRHNLLCIADEVYEWLVYPKYRHIKIASLPGMWSRTLTIGSAGKTFSVTGWKLGWTVGPANLIQALQLHQQNTIYTCPTIVQEAVARSLEIELDRLFKPESYFNEMPALIEPKGIRMVEKLNEVGMNAVLPAGGYFLIADVSKLDVPQNELDPEPSLPYDVKFNNWMMRTKEDSLLEKAYSILKNW